jgi:Domain of unknown function (DUF4394)/IPTL-CTERM motif
VRQALRLGIVFVALVSWMRPAATEAETIYAVTTTNALLTFDSATPGTTTSVAITGLQAGESIVGIDLRPTTGQLYGLGSSSRLYTINPATGAATQVGSGPFTPALSGTSFGFDFNPVVDRIRVVSDADQNFRLNPDTGAVVATDVNLAYATGDSNQGVNPNVVALAYTNNFSGAASTTLFGIDSNLDIALLLGSPGGTPISPNSGQLFSALPLSIFSPTKGPILLDTSDAVGFDFSGLTGTGYLSLTSPQFGTSFLYTVGAQFLTFVGTIGMGLSVVDITVGVQGTAVTPTPTVTATVTATSSPTVTSTAQGGGAPAQVPTLSGWALTAMILLLGFLGYVVARNSPSG